MPDADIDRLNNAMRERVRELEAQGLDTIQAHSVASLQERVALWPVFEQWPTTGHDELQILIYGDFSPPETEISLPALGIVIAPGKQENTVVHGASCVLKATVAVDDKSIPAVIDAARRINVLLGAYTLVEWGNSMIGWWSWITHTGSGGCAIGKLGHSELPQAIEGVLRLKPEVRRKVDAALYWVREPRNSFLDTRRDTLRVYSAYWNVFECLVDAICLVLPMPRPSRDRKQALLDGFIKSRKGRLTPRDIQDCYQQVVSPGLVGKASHVLGLCFGDEADAYIHECFRLPDEDNRLYNIRNAINHGDIDAENPEELARVDARLHLLWLMVWRMFGRLIPFGSPGTSPHLRPRSPVQKTP